jgi:hypothetical protein
MYWPFLKFSPHKDKISLLLRLVECPASTIPDRTWKEFCEEVRIDPDTPRDWFKKCGLWRVEILTPSNPLKKTHKTGCESAVRRSIELFDTFSVTQGGQPYERQEKGVQDELEILPLCPILSISDRNMHRILTNGKSIVQLVFAPQHFPNRR